MQLVFSIHVIPTESILSVVIGAELSSRITHSYVNLMYSITFDALTLYEVVYVIDITQYFHMPNIEEVRK